LQVAPLADDLTGPGRVLCRSRIAFTLARIMSFAARLWRQATARASRFPPSTIATTPGAARGPGAA